MMQGENGRHAIQYNVLLMVVQRKSVENIICRLT